MNSYTNFLSVKKSSGLVLQHKGPFEGAKTFLSKNSSSFFEVEILNSRGSVCVGLAHKKMAENWTVGWEDSTYAVDSSGQLYNNGFESEHILSFSKGDKIGVFHNKKEHYVSFFLNGESLGQNMQRIHQTNEGFWPAVTLRHPGDSVLLRFGDELSTLPGGLWK